MPIVALTPNANETTVAFLARVYQGDATALESRIQTYLTAQGKKTQLAALLNKAVDLLTTLMQRAFTSSDGADTTLEAHITLDTIAPFIYTINQCLMQAGATSNLNLKTSSQSGNAVYYDASGVGIFGAGTTSFSDGFRKSNTQQQCQSALGTIKAWLSSLTSDADQEALSYKAAQDKLNSLYVAVSDLISLLNQILTAMNSNITR